MKKYLSLILIMANVLCITAQNRMHVTKKDGSTTSYKTTEVNSVNFNNSTVTVNQAEGATNYDDSELSRIYFQKVSSEQIQIIEVGGWFEAGYVEFELLDGVNQYNVYYKKANETADNYQKLDGMLVRSYGSYGRADMVGLAAGEYNFKIVGVDAEGEEIATTAIETTNFTAIAHDRSGFAHFGYEGGIGAYNNDGTLKSNAKVIYVTAETAKTVTCEVKVDKNNETRTGLQDIIQAYQKGTETAPLCVRIIGTIKAEDMDRFDSSAEGLQVKGRSNYSNMPITIEGIGEDATIHGWGILIRNCTGVELRNFAIMDFMDDGLSFDTGNSNCWVHNIDFFYGQTGGDSDQAKGDGSLDLKGGTRYMTLSYLHFWDSGKMSLCGMGGDNEEWISYHHNWFDHTDSRHPRVRCMTVHVYNNYFDGVSKYGVGATTGSDIFVENNYFRNTNKPMMISLQGSDISGDGEGTFSGEDGGMIKSYGNVFAECSSNFSYVTYQQNNVEFDAYEASTRDEQVPSSVTCKVGGDTYNNFDTDASKIYEYTADDANNVPSIVMANAGRMNGGDFTWTFNNATDDADYSVNTTLKNAIANYTSSLVSIIGYGAESNTGNQGGSTTDPGEEGGGSTTEPGEGGDSGETGGNEGGIEISGSVTCHFTGKTPSNNAFTIDGNYSDSKGSVTVNGVTYTDCLKIESSTSITFTITEPMTLTLVLDASGKGIKIDGEEYTTDSEGIVTVELSAGSLVITIGDSMNLYFISLQSIE